MSEITWQIEPSEIGRLLVPSSDGKDLGVFYTTRDFPGFLNSDSVAALRDVMRSRFGKTAVLATCNQVHGARVVSPPASDEPWCETSGCDALWSDRGGLGLGIKVADCLPVTVVDGTHGVMANIHAGWRGSVKKIIARTFDTLRAGSSFDAKHAVALLGPAIRQCCFEIGPEVVDQFREGYGEIDRYVDLSRAKPHLDLAGLATQLLGELGVGPDSIHDSGICTRCEGSIFHSFRRDAAASGRNLAIVVQ
ncbi:MAG TPA: polyphenol oxidase family protein [Thermoanaerobaculia bacterium]|nr:polyphenol oxidase family protein [Thermoanaerobaculia bacterium]